MNELGMSYLDWLRWIVGRSGTVLSDGEAVELFEKPFVPILEMDKNRAIDGLVLRDIYKAETGKDAGINGRCTMLEMMIALARHMFDIMDGWGTVGEADNTIGRWFHEMLDNVAKPRERSSWDSYRWDDALERVLNREYKPNGEGGFFPRTDDSTDQRKVEIWDQMNGYLVDWY